MAKRVVEVTDEIKQSSLVEDTGLPEETHNLYLEVVDIFGIGDLFSSLFLDAATTGNTTDLEGYNTSDYDKQLKTKANEFIQRLKALL